MVSISAEDVLLSAVAIAMPLLPSMAWRVQELNGKINWSTA
jgi:hypothetical protein